MQVRCFIKKNHNNELKDKKKFQFQMHVYVVALLVLQRLKSTFFEKKFFISGLLSLKKFQKTMILALSQIVHCPAKKWTFFRVLAHCVPHSSLDCGS